MKIKFLYFTLFTAISTSALAVTPSAQLQINGDIKPPTCSINGGNQEILFDYGNISPSIIPESTNYALGSQYADIKISCDVDTFLTFTISDLFAANKASTWKEGMFGLVNANDNQQEVGGYLIRISSVEIDGKKSFVGRVGGPDWKPHVIVKDAITGWTSESQTVTNKNNLKLASGKIFSATLETGGAESNPYYGYILSKQELTKENIDISEGLDYIGQATITFSFGV
ncbi:type 1 fimbrial protein [Proteus mirabilis]|uniref:type 1 fimbrial protein n=1 Tax=Proteus mirabilis TaxID=584 RepID=UPI0029E0B853|nr:type 1 fimbrial protein [Proteus mirabilis]HEJ9437100.1 type 1 fimbrial protein [Proteus mirabilis]HEJ9659892.1 type 1 fimbrial protein [Proteus mirabilis]